MTDTRPPTAVETSAPAPANANVTTLVSGILDDAHKLLRQQFEMLKAEVKEDVRRSKRAAEFGALGIVMLTVGFLGLVACLAYFLHEHYGFSMWASCGITGGLFLAIGGTGGHKLHPAGAVQPAPGQDFNALQENLSWKTT